MAQLTFDEEFDEAAVSFWNATYAPAGVWRDNYGFGGINDYTLPGESELYAGPYFDGHPGDFNDGNYLLANGVLSLTAHATANPEVTALGYAYDSGMITTRGLEPWLSGGPTAQFAQEYGYFEMKAQFPTDPGTWAAFWLLPSGGTSAGWNPGEADIAEAVGKEAGALWQATHGATEAGSYASGVNVADHQFHTFALDWTATTLTWYVDGVATRTEATPADMHQPYAIFADLALGGAWAGPIDLSPTGGSDALQIDSIKVWDSNPYAAPPPPPPASPPPPPPPPPTPMGADLSLSPPSLAQAEGSGGGVTWFVFTVTRTGDLTGPTTAQFAVTGSGGHPADAADFDGGLPSGTVFFGGGESVKQIWVPVLADSTPEADEGFTVTLSDPTGAVITGAAATGTILNDDAQPAAPPPPPAGETLIGTRGGDVLTGGAGADTILAAAGDDTITGGAGDDVLSGGKGADSFVFGPAFGRDAIVDFTPGGHAHDTLVFSAALGAPAASLTPAGEVISFADGDAVALLGVHTLSAAWVVA